MTDIKPCPTCGGSGVVEIPFGDCSYSTYEDQCPSCDGSGRIGDSRMSLAYDPNPCRASKEARAGGEHGSMSTGFAHMCELSPPGHQGKHVCGCGHRWVRLGEAE